MYISKSSFKSILSNEKEYRQGRLLDIKQVLDRLSISQDEQQQRYRVVARLTEGKESYVILMKITYKGEIAEYQCNCEHPKACRHLVSLIFFLSQLKIETYPYTYERNMSGQREEKMLLEKQQKLEKQLNKKTSMGVTFIDEFKEQLYRESFIPITCEKYQLKAVIKQKKETLRVSLRVLATQPYMVKNLNSFFHAVKNNENLKYGKSFEFVHHRDAFDDDSKEVYDFMALMYQKGNYEPENVVKELIIKGDDVTLLYNVFSSLPHANSDIGYDTIQQNISVEMLNKEDMYILNLQDAEIYESLIMNNDGCYELMDDILYQYTFIQPKRTIHFLKTLLKSKEGLFFSKDVIDDFYKYVYSDVKDDVELITSEKMDYYSENRINLYGDIVETDQICLQIEYLYDDHIQYAFLNTEHQSKEADLVEAYIKPFVHELKDNMIYLSDNHDHSYNFAHEGLTYLAQFCEVYISDSLKQMTQVKSLQFQVGVRLSNGLLEVDIDSTDLNKDELFDILKSFKKQRKFYKLKNGEVISLEQTSLQELDDLTRGLHLNQQDLSQGAIKVPTYRLYELEHQMANHRSEERRVGKECVSTCRSRGWP